MDRILSVGLIVFSCFSSAFSQQSATSAPAAAGVPRLVSFGGVLQNASGKAQTGIAGVTFAIYKDQHDGAPLWVETQNVAADKTGRYTVQLGSTRSDGLPADLFASGEARWLGVQVSGQAEQPRVLLLSVPYALKAADAETVGGLPPSAFVRAVPPGAPGGILATDANPGGGLPTSLPPPATITGAGSPNFVPLFTGAATVGNSALFQSGASPTAKIGINTNSPTATLDVKGSETVRGTLTLPATGVATAAAGKYSQPQQLVASSFSSSTSTPLNQTFQWQAEPANNNTTHPGATLNLLYGLGATKPSETGLRIGPKGIIGFAPGQNFPGSVTSVGLTAPATDFTISGTPVTGTGILGLHWNVAPTASDIANSIVKRDASGGFSGGVITSVNLTASNPTGVAVWGQSSGASGGSDGVHGVTSSAAASGVAGVNTNNGIGVYGVGGIGVYGTSSTQQAIWGETTATGYANGSGPDGVHGVTHSNAGSGVGGLNTADAGVGVWGEAPTGFGFYTPNNVQQARSAGGWVKAMLYVNADTAPYTIVRCFNSTLAGAAATKPPCGFNYLERAFGLHMLDFGFEVDDRFVIATPHHRSGVAFDDYTCSHYGCPLVIPQVCLSSDPDAGCTYLKLTVNQAVIVLLDTDRNLTNGSFYVVVY